MNIFNVPESLITRHYTATNDRAPYRTDFMQDRDRIMYATAFRRLAGKTQIFTVGQNDHRKNRLTHTLEVAQIARTIASALGFNADLAEAIALSHDFGHTPFGHAGEQILHDIMTPNSNYIKQSPFYNTIEDIKACFERENPENVDKLESIFGFKHNIQSVRVAASLEDSYRGDNNENIGLNLTNFTLYGMMIHSGQTYPKKSLQPNFQNQFDAHFKLVGSNEYAWSFEAYIVKWADDIAQWHHDLEDAIREDVLPMKTICETILDSFGDRINSADKESLNNMKGTTILDRKNLALISHIVVNTLVTNLVNISKENLKTIKNEIENNHKNITNEELFTSYDSLNLSIKKEKVIDISSDIKTDAFKETIHNVVHHSRNVERMNEKGKYIIRKLFEAYYAHPQQLPDGPILHILVEIDPQKFKNIDDLRVDGVGSARVEFEHIMSNPKIYTRCILMRRICDHIASMTDHYAIQEYNNLYG